MHAPECASADRRRVPVTGAWPGSRALEVSPAAPPPNVRRGARSAATASNPEPWTGCDRRVYPSFPTRLPPMTPRPPPGKPSRPSGSTRRGRSSGARPARVTATRSASSAVGAPSSSRCSTYRSSRACPRTGHIADRLLAVPFRQVARARLRGPRRRHPAGGRRRRVRAEFSVAEVVDGDRRGRASCWPTGAASRPTTRSTAELVERDHPDEIGQGEGANLVVGRHYRAHGGRLGRRPRADGVPAAARARARRVLDLRLLHR